MYLLRSTLLSLSENRWAYDFILKHNFSRKMSRRFIAGESLNEAVLAIRQINTKGMTATFDRLGENVGSRDEALQAVQAYLEILGKIEENQIQSNISLKLTELGLDISEDFCFENLKKIVAKADQLNNFIRIDMEGSPYTERTLRIFKRLSSHYKNVGVVIQSYLRRSEKDVEDLIEMKARVRLCKGAYKEPAEIAFAKKREVDENYVKLMKRLLLAGNYPGIATHDLKIMNEAKHFVAEKKIANSQFEFQMLYGIRRPLEEELIKERYNLRIYVPYGEKWYPYFMRRLAERPANLIFFVTSLLRG